MLVGIAGRAKALIKELKHLHVSTRGIARTARNSE